MRATPPPAPSVTHASPLLIADDEELDDDGQPKPKKVKFSEAHRLAYAVGQMDAQLAVVPRGAYAVTATHYVVKNSGFGGAWPLRCVALSVVAV